MTAEIMPMHVLAHLAPDVFANATPAVKAALIWNFILWARPEQRLPRHAWRTCGFSGGRGFGKSVCIANEIDRRVRAGLERKVGLIAPTEDRVDEVQIAALIDVAPPWDRPEPYKGGLRWPNGVVALGFTPLAPGRSRSENLSLTWACEIVDWNPSSMVEAYDNITTATRIGRAQVVWDSTSKGRNELLGTLRENNRRDPRSHVIVPGEMFDNPLLSLPYLRSEWQKYAGVRRDEEIRGMSFDESDGALWKQVVINRTRVDAPPELDWHCIGVDPAQSTHSSSDETGLVDVARGRDGHAYTIIDRSGTYKPEAWGDIVVAWFQAAGGRARVVIERNHLGDNAVYVIRSRATNAGLEVRTVGREEAWPDFDPRVIWVREVVSRDTKADRAQGPAAEADGGRAHHVGVFESLEKEQTTWVPGARRSPNRLDAYAFAVTEVRGLNVETKDTGEADARAAAALNDVLAGRVTPGSSQAIPVGAHLFAGRSRRLGI